MNCQICNAALTDDDVSQNRCANCHSRITHDKNINHESDDALSNAMPNKGTMDHQADHQMRKEDMEQCSKCNELLRSDADFCHKCGQARYSNKRKVCQVCGRNYEFEDEFCQKDGTQLVADSKSNTIPAKRGSIILDTGLPKAWLGFWWVYLFVIISVLAAISAILMPAIEPELADYLGYTKLYAVIFVSLALISFGLVFRYRLAVILVIGFLVFGSVAAFIYLGTVGYDKSQNGTALGTQLFWIVYFIKNWKQFYK